jgi:hypothetical protein
VPTKKLGTSAGVLNVLQKLHEGSQ